MPSTEALNGLLGTGLCNTEMFLTLDPGDRGATKSVDGDACAPPRLSPPRVNSIESRTDPLASSRETPGAPLPPAPNHLSMRSAPSLTAAACARTRAKRSSNPRIASASPPTRRPIVPTLDPSFLVVVVVCSPVVRRRSALYASNASNAARSSSHLRVIASRKPKPTNQNRIRRRLFAPSVVLRRRRDTGERKLKCRWSVDPKMRECNAPPRNQFVRAAIIGSTAPHAQRRERTSDWQTSPVVVSLRRRRLRLRRRRR